MLCHYDKKRKIVNFKLADIVSSNLISVFSAGNEFFYAAYSLHAYLRDEN